MKKILAIVLAVVMLLPVFAVNSFAADNAAEEIVVFDSADGVKAGEGQLEDCVNGWDFFGMGGLWGRKAANILDVTADKVKELINEGGVTFSFDFGGNPGDSKLVFNGDFEHGISFKVKSLGEGKNQAYISLDDAKAKWEALGKNVNEISSMVIQHYIGNLVLYSAKFTYPAATMVEKEVEVDLASVNADNAEGFKKTDDGVSFTGGRITFKLPQAVAKGETIKVHVTGKANGVFRSFLSDAASKGSNWNKSPVVFFPTTMMDDDGNFDVVVEYTAEADLQYILFAKANSWDIPAGETKVADDITINSVSTFILVPAEAPAKKVPGYKGCIYVDEQYHAYLIGGHFIVMSHEDNGFGRCGACFYEIPAVEEDGVPQDKVVYDMTATQGQDIEASLADGVVLADNQEGQNNCRIATNWVGGGKVWGDVTKAIADNADAYVKIVYTGTVDKFMFQSANGGYEEVAVEVSNVEDDKNVAFISCADIIAASPVALGGDLGGWANMMLHYEGETTLYGFSVIVPAPVTLPDEEVIEVVDPTEANNTDEEDETPDNTEVVEQPEDKNPPTGIALAVLPMIVAAAACVASKRK